MVNPDELTEVKVLKAVQIETPTQIITRLDIYTDAAEAKPLAANETVTVDVLEVIKQQGYRLFLAPIE